MAANLQLRPYQEEGIVNVARCFALGPRKVVMQLATGGGKTVMFSGITHRFLTKQQKSTLILVDREELLLQARQTLWAWYGLNAFPVVSGTRYVPPHEPCYVAMVETYFNRLKRRQPGPSNLGLVIIDECHVANFHKLIPHFPTELILGCTATPLTASRKHPLKEFYEQIVTVVDIPELIEQQALAQNITFSAQNVERKKLKMKGDDFDETMMAQAFSVTRHIQNTVREYEKHALGTKTLVFNCNVAHSLRVTEAFQAAGHQCQHLDASFEKEHRRQVLRWFKETPGAVLCNIGILTKGFDEPTVETVIMNRATTSLTLWLQCTGRGSRVIPGKDHFTIIDMGGNALSLGDWSDRHNWFEIFHKPPKPGKSGVAPVKLCPKCEAIVAAGASVCKNCGHVFSTKQIVEAPPTKLQRITHGIRVDQILRRHEREGYKKHYTLYMLGRKVVNNARQAYRKMTPELARELYAEYQKLVNDWHAQTKLSYSEQSLHDEFYKELKQRYPSWQQASSASTTT